MNIAGNVVIVVTKSGAARVCGQMRPRPPEARLSWLMRIVEGGTDGRLRREAKKLDMISSLAEVRGPFHSSRCGWGPSRGRL